jgi:hypothetical protein
MTDYRLDGLSTRTFEHLVQALCIRAVCDDIMPFGDGPDGGREATFDGPTNYKIGPDHWNGFGVIQAKFLQRPKTTASDGTWALSQLKKELNQYAKRDAGRKIDYYIFATNVTLSPDAERGGKDKLVAELAKFATKHHLRGFDIWDYDKVRILLDNNEQVRRSYMAWITPGDVLADLAESLKRDLPNYYQLAVRFLQKELQADQFAKLEQAGHSADEAIPLSQVFVDLPVATQKQQDSYVERGEEVRQLYFADFIIRESAQNCLADDENQISPSVSSSTPIGRHVLIGGPGQGKTTVGQYICQVFRAALLECVKPDAIAPEVLPIMRSIQRQWQNGEIAKPQARRLPFRVVLSELATSLSGRHCHSLMGYLTSQFNHRARSNLSETQFQTMLCMYPGLLVLDGLDEVPASTNRTEVLSAVKDFWADVASSRLADAGIDIMVIATSRPQGYNEDFSRRFYAHHWLVPLSPDQAIEYGSKLAAVRFGADTDRVSKVNRRILRAAQSDAIARLMQTPLQVTILTLLLDRMGQPPQERWPLFDEYFKLIYQREIERDIPAAATLRNYKPNIVTVHRQVGLLLQVESERSGGTDARLTLDQFRDVVESHLRDEGYAGEELRSIAGSIIDGAANRLVFLVGLELGQVGFEIRSLQEFMAAEGLMAAGDELTQDRLKAVSGSSNWRNVFMFAAGKCFAERQYLRDTIYAACSELNDHPNDTAARITLAGSELALELLEEGSAQRQPKWNRMLTRVALRLLEDTSAEWSKRLAEVWHRESDDLYMAAIRAAVASTNASVVANGWLCVSHLDGANGSDASSLLSELIATQSFSDDTYEALLRHGSHASNSLNEALSAEITRHPARIFVSATRLSSQDDRDNPCLRLARPGAPAWVEGLARICQKGLRPGNALNVRVRYNGTQVAKLHIGDLVPRTLMKEEFSAVAEMFLPGASLDWLVLSDSMKFLLSPGKDNLALGASHYSSTVTDSGALTIGSSLVPWPLREIMLACVKCSPENRQLLTDASPGSFGDKDEWLEWQEDWAERGIDLDQIFASDILKASQQGCPWFPHRVAVRMYQSQATVPFGDLINLTEQVSAEPRSLIAKLAADMINRHQYRRRSEDIARPEFLAALFDASWRAGLLYLFSAAPGNLPDRESLILLDKAAANVWPHALRSIRDNEITLLLQRSWLRAPDLKNLLIPLASLGAPVSVPQSEYFLDELLALDASDSTTKVKLARIILLLRGNRWEPSLDDELCDLASSGSHVFWMIAQCFDTHPIPTVDRERALLKLFSIASASGTLNSNITPYLRESIRARRSPLTVETEWNRLGFPRDLSRIISNNLD